MKIICIGRNYAAHVVELDHTRELPSEPQFFMKPDTALLRNNDPFYVPSFSNEVHYETELVVRICRLDCPETEARTTLTDPFAAPSGTWESFPMETEPDAYAKLLANFALAVNSGRSDNLFAPWGEARKSLLISNAVYLSSWEGGTVTIPLPGSEEELLFEGLDTWIIALISLAAAFVISVLIALIHHGRGSRDSEAGPAVQDSRYSDFDW